MGKTVHIDLAERDPDMEGQWIDVRNPRRMAKRVVDQFEADLAAGAIDHKYLVSQFVAAWHVCDEQTGASMSDPANDDIGGLSVTHFDAITNTLATFRSAAVAAPGSDRPDLRVVDGDQRGPDAAA